MTSVSPISSWPRAFPIKLARPTTPCHSPIGNQRLNAERRSTAQDKWRDRDRQIHAAGPSTSRHRPAVARRREHVGERGRDDGIDSARPTLFSSGFAGSGEIFALDDLTRAEAYEAIGVLRAARPTP
jgi:hypothetical protein